MIEFEGVVYCNAAAAARFLGIKRCMFYTNVKGQLRQYKVGARRRLLYRQHDLEKFNTIELMKKAS
jgi:hypothetical protein